MTDFTIILNSRDTKSWIGTDIYNAYYYIDLSSLLDYNFDFSKNYKVSFSCKGSQSLILVGKKLEFLRKRKTFSIRFNALLLK